MNPSLLLFGFATLQASLAEILEVPDKSFLERDGATDCMMVEC